MLVVDDDEVIRRLIAVNLQLEGFEVSMAVDGSTRYSDLVELPDGSAVHYYRSQLPPRVSMVLDNYAVPLVA